MCKLLIVDGNNLLFQMFFGMPSRIVGKRGKPIQGVLGFVGAILKMLRTVNPTHAAVIFDGEHENVRRTIDPDYKANRPDYGKEDDDLNPFTQIDDVKRALDFMKIKHAETDVCEADDWIASYVCNLKDECEIVIASLDSDFFQLISDSVSVFRYRGDRSVSYTPEIIRSKLLIEPAQYADYKSLVGDRSDNISGAPMIGAKTAAALLGEFHSLEEIIARSFEIDRPGIRTSITNNAERLLNNYRLIKLTGDYALPFELSQLSIEKQNTTTSAVLRAIGLM